VKEIRGHNYLNAFSNKVCQTCISIVRLCEIISEKPKRKGSDGILKPLSVEEFR